MRTPKYHLYLTDEKYSLVMQAWVLLKNKLIQDGRYTDAVDELIIKLSKAKRKKVRIGIRIAECSLTKLHSVFSLCSGKIGC